MNRGNRRRLLLNSKFQMLFGAYTFVSMIVAIVVIVKDYIQIFVPVFMTEQTAATISVPLKIMLLPGWVIFTFLIFYLYMNARILGVFQRISDACEKIILGESAHLNFRAKDSFSFVAETFNAMVEKLRFREKSFANVILATRRKLKSILKDKKDAQKEIEEIIKDIDKIAIDEDVDKDKNNLFHS